MLAVFKLLLQFFDMLHPLDLDIVVTDCGLFQGNLLLAHLFTQPVETFVAVEGLAHIPFLFICQREQAEYLELTTGIANLLGQRTRVLQLQEGDGRFLLLEIELTE